jgi:hypothetical protein
VQLTGRLNLTSVDFISAQVGWTVGTATLLSTTDGGLHWTPLQEPCPLIRSVHFVSPETGFAVAGGSPQDGPARQFPYRGGVVLTSTDGGRTWQRLRTPANAETVCFDDQHDGWLGAGERLYRTSDGGLDWTAVPLAGNPDSYSAYGTLSVQCAGAGSAWVLSIGAGAMSQDAHVGYHADRGGVTPLFAEQYFRTPGSVPTASSPGSDPGPPPSARRRRSSSTGAVRAASAPHRGTW